MLLLAYILAAVFLLPAWIVSQVAPAGVTPGDHLKAINDVRGALLGLLSPLAVVVAGIAALLSFRETRRQNMRMFEITRRQLDLSLEDQVNERFSRAIGQLGSENLDVRVGAIYSLEQIARDTPVERPGDMYLPTVGTLTAFIREHTRAAPMAGSSGRPPESDSVVGWPTIAEDVQTVLNVLGRRDVRRDRYNLNLRRATLDGARFRPDANFDGTRFEGASLRRVNLEGVRLQGANFEGASLEEANLQAADLSGANLQDANLSGANLKDANLRGANLHRTIFERAPEPAVQGLTWEQLKQGDGVDEASLPPNLRSPLRNVPKGLDEAVESG